MRTDLIHYLVRMMMVVVAVLCPLYTRNESNYPVVNNSRESRDADCFIHLIHMMNFTAICLSEIFRTKLRFV